MNTDRAFDKVLEEVYGKTAQQINEVRQEMSQQIANMASEAKDQTDECARISAEAERERTVVTLSKKQAANKVRKFRKVREFGYIPYLLAGGVLVAGLIIYVYEISPAYHWLVRILPAKILESIDIFMLAWTLGVAGIGLIFRGIDKVVEYLGSEKRETALYERFYRKNKSMIN